MSARKNQPLTPAQEAADLRWMRRALTLARRGVGLTSPNPCVGAVLVRNGKLLGSGWHKKAGEAHAEINALADAQRRGHSVRGATLYVTLEPCSTQGRTGPCCDAIQRAGIARVVCAAVDCNPAHSGRGLRLLQKAGVEVVSGLLAEESNDLNRAFNRWITTRRPWVLAKIAMSLDGKIAPPPRPAKRRAATARAGQENTAQQPHNPWITSQAARDKGHELRLWSDAIIVGAETVRADNPALTVRLSGSASTRAAAAQKQQPWRVVMTRSGSLPQKAQLFTDAQRERTRILQNKSWPQVLRELGALGCTAVLLEGGGELLSSALRAGVVDEIAFFIAPRLIGGTALAFPQSAGKSLPKELRIEPCNVEKVGPDFLVRGYVHRID